ncbi:hypothetical protein LF1_51680 [Rubripirellula obstinata]|uniref:PEP-CTERM protein-sorting domain-containing protein n=1 Tax=Rubripirellula obstinata TaxID=406547 RepID=A0A5B1CQS5_9BACT|nr:hypothetical protein [Rubripirellula obstinata]KAA1262601.1 hypothetical protein LF1_51680 [Rubripirellula obstinata]
MRSFLRTALIVFASIAVGQFATNRVSLGQSFVEYSGTQVYGDHTRNSTWDGGPTGVTVRLETDENILHEDGDGGSQRTALNTQTFSSPSSEDNPQNYDNLSLVNLYGERLPLLQQMSANGTSVLNYVFNDPVNTPLDLFVTDVDFSDSVSVKAFDAQGMAMDMSQWTLVDEGDLSVFKDTGSDFSEVTAPTPVTLFSINEISLTATDDTNYNRSYSILRNPINQDLSRIEITFVGTQNSPSRAMPNTGSHIYTALATAIPEPSSILVMAGCFGLVTFRRRRIHAARSGS